MNQERLSILKQFVEEDPNDPFNWYALGLEESKKDTFKALELFEYVMKNHPGYLPVYYHAANLYLSTGNGSRAKEILNEGITLAKKNGEQKTMQELNTLLNEVLD